jgi:uncharacterized coiled-coil DUF342 family protein
MSEEQAVFHQLDAKIEKVVNAIESVRDKQDEMAEDVSKIKEAVYDPDQGLYARIRELESWKNTSSKMIWTLFTSVIGIISAFILKSFP